MQNFMHSGRLVCPLQHTQKRNHEDTEHFIIIDTNKSGNSILACRHNVNAAARKLLFTYVFK